MGTRADFYIGRGVQAEWIGSIAWDGHPDTVMGKRKDRGEPNKFGRSDTEAKFRKRFLRYVADLEDAAVPPAPWPWPWADSRMTDYVYAFDDGGVWVTDHDNAWTPIEVELGDRAAPGDDDGSVITITEEQIQGWVAESQAEMAKPTTRFPRMKP